MEALDSDQKTPIIWAPQNGFFATVKLLLEKGAIIGERDEEKMTPLIQASENGFLEVAQLLLENGADCKARDNLGKTARTHAFQNGRLRIVIVSSIDLASAPDLKRKKSTFLIATDGYLA